MNMNNDSQSFIKKYDLSFLYKYLILATFSPVLIISESFV